MLPLDSRVPASPSRALVTKQLPASPYWPRSPISAATLPPPPQNCTDGAIVWRYLEKMNPNENEDARRIEIKKGKVKKKRKGERLSGWKSGKGKNLE